MVFSSLTKVTGNYIKIAQCSEKTVRLPVLISQQKLNFLMEDTIRLHEPLCKIVNLITELDSVKFDYTKGFVLVQGYLTYLLTYANKDNMVKSTQGKYFFTEVIDLRPVLPEVPPQACLDYLQKHSLSQLAKILNCHEVKLTVLTTLEVSIYQPQDLSVC